MPWVCWQRRGVGGGASRGGAPPPWGGQRAGASGRARPIEASLAARYVEEVLALRPAGPADRRLRIVYTPMHGVGRALAERVLRLAGFADWPVGAEEDEP